tara:strand:+ start:1793 stop:2149 length:357 start_codon:yes stop_codon:yes gene_type:complete
MKNPITEQIIKTIVDARPSTSSWSPSTFFDAKLIIGSRHAPERDVMGRLVPDCDAVKLRARLTAESEAVEVKLESQIDALEIRDQDGATTSQEIRELDRLRGCLDATRRTIISLEGGA